MSVENSVPLVDANRKVRVRIAPSPTGDPHVGTAYIALFNYVFAKKYGGSFLLRIEDTDQVRSNKASEEAILRALRWVGLSWDEGPDVGGAYGPYRQSERTDLYKKHADILLQNGSAYRCFCTADRLDAMRKAQRAQGQLLGYDRFCRFLSGEEIKAKLEQKIPYVVRMAIPLEGKTSFYDHLRGEISVDNSTVDDQILLKSDGFPTYHLANVVDDHLMEISHVIRAEEWIISTPKHIQLYKAFGWQSPQFIHMPLLRNPDRSKISKRKNPISLDYYRDAGFLPEALLNFLALMGFSFGDNREFFSLKEMVDVFDVSHISVGEPIFDLVKLRWLNGVYIRSLDAEKLLYALRSWRLSDDFLRTIIPLEKERVETLGDFIPAVTFFLSGDLDYKLVLGDLVPKNRTAKETSVALQELADFLDEKAQNQFVHDRLDAVCREFAEKIQWKTKELFMSIRVAVTGRVASPPLFDTLVALGKDLTRRRIRMAAKALEMVQPK